MVSILELMDIQTGEVRELRRFDHRIEAPFFRGEKELLFNDGGRIYCLRLDSDELSVIPTGFCTHCNNDHVLSPDGKQLAVSHHTAEDGGSRIYIVDLEGDQPPRLVTPLAPSYLHGWSPDGEMLAYCAGRSGEFDVYAVPAAGGVERRLTFSDGLNDGPEYGPDGKIYFNSVRAGLMDCYVMEADGSSPRRITDNGRNNWFPHISPDNQTIVYISYAAGDVEPGDHPPDKHVELRKILPDGTGDTLLRPLFGGQGTINVNSWSPDSRYIAYVRYEV